MNCTTAMDFMLEADARDLAGGTESELGQHLRTCAPCRSAAERILAAEGALRRALGGALPRRATP
ncbi:MAG: hypothetical protein ACREMV_13740, partial [Gemmatimonadales bacterium]